MENLIQRLRDGRLRNVALRVVISSRAAVRGVEVARTAGLPVHVVRRRDFDEVSFSTAITSALDAAGAELVVLAGFLCFWQIPPHYAGRVLNIHPALLPRFGGRGFYGRHVHEAVLAAGVTESGCTVHIADNEYDHGPIVAQSRVPVLPGDTPETLAERVGVAERELYPQVIQEVADHGVGWLRGFPGDPGLRTKRSNPPAGSGRDG
jgi:formyltetrahydrofolate-dependent phosphoribosylglycinamide formyltransferase